MRYDRVSSRTINLPDPPCPRRYDKQVLINISATVDRIDCRSARIMLNLNTFSLLLSLLHMVEEHLFCIVENHDI